MVIIIMGISGSGKTTVGQQLADDLGWKYFDGDDFHSVKNIAKMSVGIPLNDDDRSVWLSQISQHIKELIKKHDNAVVSCSALKQEYRRQLQNDSEAVKFVYLKGPKALIKKRLESRSGHFMSVDLINSQFETLEEPEQVLVVDIKQSPKIISNAIQQHFDIINNNQR